MDEKSLCDGFLPSLLGSSCCCSTSECLLVQFSLFSMLFCALPSLFFMHCAKTLSFVYASLNIFIFPQLFLDQRKVKSDFRRKF